MCCVLRSTVHRALHRSEVRPAEVELRAVKLQAGLALFEKLAQARHVRGLDLPSQFLARLDVLLADVRQLAPVLEEVYDVLRGSGSLHRVYV